MTVVVALLMIAVVAGVVALPFVRPTNPAGGGAEASLDTERLEREKNVALLAIKEAELDHAMGKLSDEDYRSLRGIYEQRALGAMSELDSVRPVPATSAGGGTGAESGAPALYCGACGNRFGSSDRFCGGCGSRRGRLAADGG